MKRNSQQRWIDKNESMLRKKVKQLINVRDDLFVQKDDKQQESNESEEEAVNRKQRSTPSNPKHVRDKYTNTARKTLFKYLFKYIFMTTPNETTSKGEETSSWPPLSTCLIIIDEYNPKTIQRGQQQQYVHEKKGKETINFITGTERDRDIIIEALHCAVSMNEHENKNYVFHHVYDLDMAYKADNFGLQKIERRRPKQGVLTYKDIIPALSFENV